MNITLKPIGADSRYVLENLFRYYLYEMSIFLTKGLSGEGVYEYKWSLLDVYWQEPFHYPYFIFYEDELAGFALIRKYPEDIHTFDVDQFFVVRAFMGKGVGKAAFNEIVRKHPGKWQVRVLIENISGLNFWRATIKGIMGDNFYFTRDSDVDLEMNFFRFEYLRHI